MASQRGKAMIDRDFVISSIDPRIYGGFIEHMGRCVYGGIYDPLHAEADELGFRKDVSELVSDLRLPIVRYPGGNFVSGFRWEDSVGPLESRPARMDVAWKSLEPNHVGLGEFHQWADQAGTTVMMAVNLGTRGVEAAAQLLEYCNVRSGTELSELRKTHGREEPYAYKVWCLGNEMDGPWQICNKTAEEYGTLARETGKVLKRLDPSIELVACGSSGIHLPTFPQWDATVLELCYEYADYLSVHMYIDNKENDLDNYLVKAISMDRYLDSIIATCDFVQTKKRSDKRMYLSFDEWNVVPSTWKDNNNADKWVVGPALCEGSYSMADAVVFGNMIISLLKRSDRVKIACLAQLVNVFGPIMTVAGGIAWKQTVYYPFLHASLFGRGIALPVHMEAPVIATKDFPEASVLDSVAVLEEGTGILTVFAVNRSAREPLELELELRGFEAYAACGHIVLQDDDAGACNGPDSPNRVVPCQLEDVLWRDGRLSVPLAPQSWNVIRLKPVRSRS